MSPEQISIYKPFRKLTFWTAGTFCILILLIAVPVLLTGALLIAPDIFVGHDRLARFGDALVRGAAVVESVVRIVGIVLFLIWVYRGFVNLTAISTAVLEFSPGGAVGWWFVPFVNIVRGYQIVRELWTFSEPDAADEGMFAVTPAAPWWMIFWWLSFIVGNIFIQITTMITESDIKKFGGMELLWGTIFIGGLLHIVSALLLIKILLGVNANQEVRYAQLSPLAPTEAPPPPVFIKEDRNEAV